MMPTSPYLAGFFDFFHWDTIGPILGWTAAILMILVGFLGVFIPVLPGTGMIFIGSLVHYFSLGREASGLAWQGLVFIGLLFVTSMVLDWISGALGAKWFGSSKWGVIGAISGGVIGLFFGLPGLIIGPLAGVFLFEILFGKKHLKEASNSTLGTVVGGAVGIAIRLVLATTMVAWYVVDVFFVN